MVRGITDQTLLQIPKIPKHKAAYVLLNAEMGVERELIAELKRIPNVEEAYLIYGAFDILVKVKGESLTKLREIVSTRIRGLKEVRSTLTMVINQSYEK